MTSKENKQMTRDMAKKLLGDKKVYLTAEGRRRLNQMLKK